MPSATIGLLNTPLPGTVTGFILAKMSKCSNVPAIAPVRIWLARCASLHSSMMPTSWNASSRTSRYGTRNQARSRQQVPIRPGQKARHSPSAITRCRTSLERLFRCRRSARHRRKPLISCRRAMIAPELLSKPLLLRMMQCPFPRHPVSPQGFEAVSTRAWPQRCDRISFYERSSFVNALVVDLSALSRAGGACHIEHRPCRLTLSAPVLRYCLILETSDHASVVPLQSGRRIV